MRTVNFNAKYISSVPFSEIGQRYYYDERLRGFGLRVGKTKKTYFAEGRIKGQSRRVTIGSTEIFTTDKARREAQKILGKMASGVDINAERSAERMKTLRLDVATQEFLKTRKLSEKSYYDYQRTMATYFSDWAGKPIKTITGEMIVKRFKKISQENGNATANKCMRVFRSIWNFTRACVLQNDGSYILSECPVKRISEMRLWHKISRRQTQIKPSEFSNWFTALEKIESRLYPKYALAVKDYLELLIRTGLRRDEAASITWSCVDLDNNEFKIEKTKNGLPLFLPMSRQTRLIFERRLVLRQNDFVFYGSGKTGHIVDARKFIPKLREASGVYFTHHDLRRTFITLADSLDISYYAIKRLVNHSMGDDVTAGYIVHSVERLREPMQRISDEIDRLRKL